MMGVFDASSELDFTPLFEFVARFLLCVSDVLGAFEDMCFEYFQQFRQLTVQSWLFQIPNIDHSTGFRSSLLLLCDE